MPGMEHLYNLQYAYQSEAIKTRIDGSLQETEANLASSKKLIDNALSSFDQRTPENDAPGTEDLKIDDTGNITGDLKNASRDQLTMVSDSIKTAQKAAKRIHEIIGQDSAPAVWHIAYARAKTQGFDSLCAALYAHDYTDRLKAKVDEKEAASQAALFITEYSKRKESGESTLFASAYASSFTKVFQVNEKGKKLDVDRLRSRATLVASTYVDLMKDNEIVAFDFEAQYWINIEDHNMSAEKALQHAVLYAKTLKSYKEKNNLTIDNASLQALKYANSVFETSDQVRRSFCRL